MKYDISVIIPVYNREKLIKNALNSVLKQTIADKIEIICVDDGSTDNTVEVIKNYQKKHENIFLYQQENSGPGVARNLGIDKANGEYIIFLDSDDWAPERAYELMLNYIREKDADVVIGRILRKIHGIRNNSWFFPERIEKYFNEYKNKNCSKEYIIPIVTPDPTNKIIRTSFLKEHNIYIPNEKMGEDLIFCLKLFKYAEKIFLLDEVVYMYESDFSNGESLCSQVSPNIIASGFRVVQDAFSFFEGQKKVFYETENILGLFQYVLERFWKLEETEEKELIFEQIKSLLSSFKDRKELYIPIQFLMKIDLDTLLLLPYKAYKLQVELLEKMNPIKFQQVEKYVDRWKSNEEVEKEFAEVRNSLSFRIGSAIMWLPCKIRDLIKGEKMNQIIKREAYWDNVRFFLILAVVIGHFVDYNTAKSDLCKATYLFIYIFHMPTFIFISGFFSKNTLTDKNKIFKKAFYYFTLFIVYKLLIFILSFAFNKKLPIFLPFSESSIPWYLLASSIWLILFYFLKDFYFFPLFVLSILVGCFIGYDKTTRDFLSWSRVLVFLPFFAVGYHITQERIDNFINPKKKFRFIALLIFIISAFLVYKNIGYFYKYRGYFTARNPFNFLINGQYGYLVRCITISMSFYFIFLILLIVPKRKFFFSYIGSKTLQIYFWHYPVLYSMNKLKILDFFRTNSAPTFFYFILVLFAVILTFILSLNIFSYPLKLLEKGVGKFIDLIYKENK